jgi:CO dehydrogenase/acetyl-CoA synthase beta subunit
VESVERKLYLQQQQHQHHNQGVVGGDPAQGNHQIYDEEEEVEEEEEEEDASQGDEDSLDAMALDVPDFSLISSILSSGKDATDGIFMTF